MTPQAYPLIPWTMARNWEYVGKCRRKCLRRPWEYDSPGLPHCNKLGAIPFFATKIRLLIGGMLPR
uniref:Uncharacterized protein n=1 Tax=Picea sitchensis TaxID=3332 RepID=D5ADC9_PICSI|nr:unknown [Picea sitchensis]